MSSWHSSDLLREKRCFIAVASRRDNHRRLVAASVCTSQIPALHLADFGQFGDLPARNERAVAVVVRRRMHTVLAEPPEKGPREQLCGPEPMENVQAQHTGRH